MYSISNTLVRGLNVMIQKDGPCECEIGQDLLVSFKSQDLHPWSNRFCFDKLQIQIEKDFRFSYLLGELIPKVGASRTKVSLYFLIIIWMRRNNRTTITYSGFSDRHLMIKGHNRFLMIPNNCCSCGDYERFTSWQIVYLMNDASLTPENRFEQFNRQIFWNRTGLEECSRVSRHDNNKVL